MSERGPSHVASSRERGLSNDRPSQYRPVWLLVLGIVGVAVLGVIGLLIHDWQQEPEAVASLPDSNGIQVGHWHAVGGPYLRSTGLAFQPGNSHDIFVSQKGGTVLRVSVESDGPSRASVYMYLRDLVQTAGNGGLLSVAFSPTFKTDGYVYVDYINLSGDEVIARLQAVNSNGAVDPAASVVRQSTLKTILIIRQPSGSEHYGGDLVFGPDGYLYISSGDQGNGGADPRNTAQTLTSLGGKILRIDVAHSCDGVPYCVPASNPVSGSHAGLAWLWGLRNPWKITFGPRDGSLWIADVGWDAWEEVDHVAAIPPVRNLGWPCYEGRVKADPRRCASGPYVMPDFVIPHPKAEELTGGVVIPAGYGSLSGRYIAGDVVLGNVWWFDPATGRDYVQNLSKTQMTGPTAFATSPDDAVYVITYPGEILRLDRPA